MPATLEQDPRTAIRPERGTGSSPAVTPNPANSPGNALDSVLAAVSYAHHPEGPGSDQPETNEQFNSKLEKRFINVDKGIMATICNWWSGGKRDAAHDALVEWRKEYKPDIERGLLNDPEAQARIGEKREALEKALKTIENRKQFTETVAKGLAVTAATIGVTLAVAPLIIPAVAGLGLGAVMTSFVAGGLVAGISSFATRAGFGYLMNGFKFDRKQLLADAGMSVVDGLCFGGAGALSTWVTPLIGKALATTTLGTAINAAATHPTVAGAALRFGTAIVEGAFVGGAGMGAQGAVYAAADADTYRHGADQVAPTIWRRTLNGIREGGIFGAIGGFFAGFGRLKAPKQNIAAPTETPAASAETAAVPKAEVSPASKPGVRETIALEQPSPVRDVAHAQEVTAANAKGAKGVAALTKEVNPEASAVLEQEGNRLSRVADSLVDTTPTKPKGDWVDDLFKQASSDHEATLAASRPSNTTTNPVQPATVTSSKPAPELTERLGALVKERLALEAKYGSMAEYGDLPPSIQQQMSRLDRGIAEFSSQLKLGQNPSANAQTVDDILQVTSNGLNGPPAGAPKPPAVLSDDDFRALWDSATEAGKKMGNQPRVVGAKKSTEGDWVQSLIDDSMRGGEGGGGGTRSAPIDRPATSPKFEREGGGGGLALEERPAPRDLDSRTGPSPSPREQGGSGPTPELKLATEAAPQKAVAVEVAEKNAESIAREEYIERLKQLAAETKEAPAPREDGFGELLEEIRALPEAKKSPGAVPTPELETLPRVADAPETKVNGAPASSTPAREAAPAPSLEEASVPSKEERQKVYAKRVEELAAETKPAASHPAQEASPEPELKVVSKPSPKPEEATASSLKVQRLARMLRRVHGDFKDHDFDQDPVEIARRKLQLAEEVLKANKPNSSGRSARGVRTFTEALKGNMAKAGAVVRLRDSRGNIIETQAVQATEEEETLTEASFGDNVLVDTVKPDEA